MKVIFTAERLNELYIESKSVTWGSNFLKVPDDVLSVYRFKCKFPTTKSQYYAVELSQYFELPTTRLNIYVGVHTIREIVPVPDDVIDAISRKKEAEEYIENYLRNA